MLRRGRVESISRLIVLDERQLQSFRKVAVVGDLHGDLDAFTSAIGTVDLGRDCIIFLGDYADRGPSGIEVIDAVGSLMRKHAESVFALKGNHESYTDSGAAEFQPCTLISEAKRKRGDWQDYFRNTLKPFIKRLKLAIIASGDTLFVHGGVSSKIRSLKDLENPTSESERDVLWADPFEGQGERPNLERFTSVEFGADVTESICKLLGVERIVRSHQPMKAPAGPFYTHNCRVVTASSTSVYGGKPFILNIDPADSSRPRYIGWSFL